MAFFTMHRDRVVATKSGHIIKFVKGEKTWVPPAAAAEVMSVGAVPEEENFELPEDKDATTKTNAGESLTHEERKAKIIEAFKLMESRNDRGDFNAAGKPHQKAVSAIVGFTVDAKENAAVWQAYVDEKADA